MPRHVVAVGLVLQLACMTVWCVAHDAWPLLLSAICLAAGSALLQFALAMVRPGALGFGDVTCTLLMGLAVGAYGVEPVLVWWLLMGVFGLSMLWIQRRRGKDSIPFAPAIVVAALSAVLLA